MMGDGLLRRHDPLVPLRDFDQRLAAAAGRRGVRRAKAARVLIRPRTDSIAETWARLAIIQDALPCPEVNIAVQTPDGRIYHLDLAYPLWHIAIEYDGAHHRTDEDQYESDKRRQADLQAMGWTLIRVTKADWGDPARFLLALRRAIPPTASWTRPRLPVDCAQASR
jgi:very-short-patch-repair endonuclease